MTSTPEQVIAKIREALEKVEVCEWFVDPMPMNNGLTRVDDGKASGIFPIRGETFEMNYVAAVNPQNISLLLLEYDTRTAFEAAWKNHRDELLGQLAAAEAERDALRKALEPFAALIERSDTMDIEWLEANAPGMELEVYTPSSDKLVSSGEMRNPIFVTRGDFRRARTLLAGDNHE